MMDPIDLLDSSKAEKEAEADDWINTLLEELEW